MSKTNNIEAELGYKGSFVLNDKALFIYFTQDLTKTYKGIPESGRYIRLGLDFHGGGSSYNFSILSFEGKYYLSLGEGLDRKIIGVEGEIGYSFGDLPDGGYLGVRLLYIMPLEYHTYLSLKIGGDSNFSSLSSFSELNFNILCGFCWYSINEPVEYLMNLESDFVRVLNLKLETKIKF